MFTLFSSRHVDALAGTLTWWLHTGLGKFAQNIRLNNFLKIRYFSRFTYKLWKESHFYNFLCCCRKELEIICITCLSLTRIINDQIMKVGATDKFDYLLFSSECSLFGRHRRRQIRRCLCTGGKCQR